MTGGGLMDLIKIGAGGKIGLKPNSNLL